MRTVLFLLLVTNMAAADALKDYRAAVKPIKSDLFKYWDRFRGRLMNAIVESERPFKNQKDNVAVADLGPLRQLYAECFRQMEAWGNADLELGKSGHPKAFTTLWKEFLALTKQIDAGEIALAEAKGIDRYRFGQEPAVRLDGLFRRLARLNKALAAWPELTTTGWNRASKFDGKKSNVRRVAVIDASNDRAFLEARLNETAPELRIAALESLVPLGASANLRIVLTDKQASVRRALLQEVAAGGDAQWIGAVLQHMGRANGLEKRLAADALKVLTNQPFGYDEKKWREWYDEYKAEIDGGKFDKKKIEVQEDKPVPPKPAFSFYGVRSTSLAPVFVIEGSRLMLTPAKWDTRVHKGSFVWWGEHKKWKDQYESQYVVLKRELLRTLDHLPDGAAWGFVVLQGKYGAYPTKRLLGISSREVNEVQKTIKRMTCSGWCSIERGLEVTVGIDPRVDTVFLVNSGRLEGGRFLTPELMLGWFSRWNRFRRIVVHALRIDNAKEDAEQTMKGLADASGGVYIWLKVPPK